MSFFNDVKRSKEKRTTGIAGKYMKDYDSLAILEIIQEEGGRMNEERSSFFRWQCIYVISLV